MKTRWNLTVCSLLAAGLAVSAHDATAQSSTPKKNPTPQNQTTPMRRGMMRHGNMMGMGMGMGMPMQDLMVLRMVAPDAQVHSRNVDNGVVIELTSQNPDTAQRLQKLAQADQLMWEAHNQSTDPSRPTFTYERTNNGASLELTSSDAQMVRSLQKIAQAHELMWQAIQGTAPSQQKGGS